VAENFQYQPSNFYEAGSEGPDVTFGATPDGGEVVNHQANTVAAGGGGAPQQSANQLTPRQQAGVIANNWFAGLGTLGKVAVLGGAAAALWAGWRWWSKRR